MTRPKIFLAYPYEKPEIEATAREAIGEFADVIVAKDEVHGSHILDKISRQMNESDVCLFDLTGNNINVVLELGMAIGHSSIYCVLRHVSRTDEPSALDFFSDIKGWDHIRYSDMEELATKLREYVPKQISRAASATKPTHVSVPVSTYESEIAETLQDAAGQGGLLIPSYVCSMSLAVHPSSFTGDRFKENGERAVIADARHAAGGGFPITGPERAVNLADGFQVTTVLPRNGHQEYREYYRFRRDGLFVLTRVSPDDIDEERQYRGQDRFIGLGQIVSTLTRMSRFASALSKGFADETTALIRISGLANHRLVDDTASQMLFLGDLQPSHEDSLLSEFHGDPLQFQKGADEWAVDPAADCLRLLNYPAVTEVVKSTVRELQKAVR